jgi:hypothetical protein
MSTVYRETADASSTYRERTGITIARSQSAAETGNLAATTRDITFLCSPAQPMQHAEIPRSQSTASTK